jgi:tetratricopeptide (TPR) repeat protein
MIHARYFVTAALVAAASSACAQEGVAPAKWADTLRTEIDKATLLGDPAKLAAARALADRVASAFPDDGLILHYQAFAMYREAGLARAQGGDSGALLERAQVILERSLAKRPLAETHALMASIDGQLIDRDPSRAMELGIASQQSTTAALTLGPNNPRVWLVRGQGSIYTPPEYGGGLKIAQEQLTRAIALFDKDTPKPGEPTWGKAEAYVWLGQVYERLGDKTKAGEAYKMALSISPEYGYAKGLAAALR